MKNLPVGAELFHADGQTDMTKLHSRFSQFCARVLKITCDTLPPYPKTILAPSSTDSQLRNRQLHGVVGLPLLYFEATTGSFLLSLPFSFAVHSTTIFRSMCPVMTNQATQ